MDDREDDEDLFENPVSMTIAQLAPLSSISEVSLHVDDLAQLSVSMDDEVPVSTSQPLYDPKHFM